MRIVIDLCRLFVCSMKKIKPIFRLFKRQLKKKVDQRIIAYIICVLIASILWFLNALNKEYNTQITYPLKYTAFPTDKYIASELPSSITLDVTAKGFSLLGHKLQTSFQPIEVNVSSYLPLFTQHDSVLTYTLRTSTIQDRIASQMSSDIKLTRIVPESIHFKLTNAKSKMVPVKVNVDYQLNPQFILKHKPSINPDSILVTGPSIIIDTIQAIYAKPLHLGLLQDKQNHLVNLIPINHVLLSTENVHVAVDIEQYTEIQLSISIRSENVPDSLRLRLLPSYTNVTCNVGLSRFDHLKAADFEFIVNYIQTKNSTYLDVVPKRIPEFVYDLTYSPKKVEYIIERK